MAGYAMRGAVAKRWRGGRVGGSRGEKARGASRWRGSAGHGVARQAACRGDDGHAPFASRMTGGQAWQRRARAGADRGAGAGGIDLPGGRRAAILPASWAHGAHLVQFVRSAKAAGQASTGAAWYRSPAVGHRYRGGAGRGARCIRLHCCRSVHHRCTKGKGVAAYCSLTPCFIWLGRKDSNLRMPESKSGALTNLATPQEF